MLIPLLIGGLLALAGAVSSSEVKKFERRAAEELAGRLEGAGKEVRVRADIDGIVGGGMGRLHEVVIEARNFEVPELPLFTEPERGKDGRIRTLRIRLSDFALRGLRIEELTADISNSRFDFGLAKREGKIRLSESGVGPGYVRMNAGALEKFILRKFREIKKVSVRLEYDKVYVEGQGDFLLFSTNFYVSAKLVARNGVEVWLENAWILLDGKLPLDGSGKILLDSLNPILDVDKDLRLFGAFQIRDLRSKNGLLELWGIATVPSDPRR